MTPVHETPWFQLLADRLADVRLNPRRHSAPSALAHAAEVAAHAAALARANGCAPAEVALLEALGWVHDVGKVTGSANSERSLEVLRAHGVDDAALFALVRWHDTSLPWFQAHRKGQPPSARAWRRLGAEVDLRHLALFLVADRVDAPPGWRGNAPTVWFLGEARARGLSAPLVLDLPDRPSEVRAGVVLSGEPAGGPLPAVPLGWDELPAEAAARAASERLGPAVQVTLGPELPSTDALEGEDPSTGARWLVRTRWFEASAGGATAGRR